MKIFKTRWFQRWARKERLSDKALLAAVKELEEGLIDADLGGSVYKKRVAQAGKGKSGGLRTVIAYRTESSTFFMYGFAKNKRTNIEPDELKVFKLLAKELLEHDDNMLDHLIVQAELYEVLKNE